MEKLNERELSRAFESCLCLLRRMKYECTYLNKMHLSFIINFKMKFFAFSTTIYYDIVQTTIFNDFTTTISTTIFYKIPLEMKCCKLC